MFTLLRLDFGSSSGLGSPITTVPIFGTDLIHGLGSKSVSGNVNKPNSFGVKITLFIDWYICKRISLTSLFFGIGIGVVTVAHRGEAAPSVPVRPDHKRRVSASRRQQMCVPRRPPYVRYMSAVRCVLLKLAVFSLQQKWNTHI